MVNMDHGIFPACTEEVRRDIGIPNTQLGIMGSIVYLGLVIGNPFHSSYSRFDVRDPNIQQHEHQVCVDALPPRKRC
jgi:hypothetical protein